MSPAHLVFIWCTQFPLVYYIHSLDCFNEPCTVLIHPLSVPGTALLDRASILESLSSALWYFSTSWLVFGVFSPNDVNNPSRWLFMWRSSKVTPSCLQWPSCPFQGWAQTTQRKNWDWSCVVHQQLTAVRLSGHYCHHCNKPPAKSLFTLQPLMHKMPTYPSLSLGGNSCHFLASPHPWHVVPDDNCLSWSWSTHSQMILKRWVLLIKWATSNWTAI